MAFRLTIFITGVLEKLLSVVKIFLQRIISFFGFINSLSTNLDLKQRSILFLYNIQIRYI